MNETTVNKMRKLGTGQYHLTRKEAGEAYRAARAHKVNGDIAAWRRPKSRRASK